jgi:histidinol-phosphate aminotransferase
MSAPEPRSGIMDIKPYVGGESAIAGKKKVIKLASNEGAFGPSPKAMAAYKKAATMLHRYPDGNATQLRKAIAARHGLDPARVVCGAGSDELLILMCKAYAGPGDEVLYTEHGFLIYPIAAKAAGATPVKVAEKDLTADVDALIARAGDKTRLLFLANPNNPTGTYLSADDMARLRAGLPKHVILVIDAAYAEFVTNNDYSPGIELVDSHDNVVMTRTFSKIFGLGGLRLGWAYCPPAIAHVLNLVRGPFNVSSPALAAGVAALDDVAFTDKARAHNAAWREWTRERLVELGLDVPKSACNFVLARFPATPGRDARTADAFLKERGIIVRRVAAYGLPDCLRVTIGLEEEMRAFVAAMKEFME